MTNQAFNNQATIILCNGTFEDYSLGVGWYVLVLTGLWLLGSASMLLYFRYPVILVIPVYFSGGWGGTSHLKPHTSHLRSQYNRNSDDR